MPVTNRQKRLFFQLRERRADGMSCPTDLSFLCCLAKTVSDADKAEFNRRQPSVLDFLVRLTERYGMVAARQLVFRACGCGKKVSCARGSAVSLREFTAVELGSEIDAYHLFQEVCCSMEALQYAWEAIQDQRVHVLNILARDTCCGSVVVAPPEKEIPPPPLPPPPIPKEPAGGEPTPDTDCSLPEPPKEIA